MAKKRDRREERERDDDDATPATPSDAYVGLLGIATAALVAAAVLLYLDYDAVGTQNPTPPAVAGAPEGLSLPGAAAK